MRVGHLAAARARAWAWAWAWAWALVVSELRSASAAAAVVVSALGGEARLPCLLGPTVDAAEMTVEWTRGDLKPPFVHVWRDGVELDGKKHPSFRNRTWLGCHCLRHGDASLTIERLRLQDAGRYTCFIPTLGTRTSVELLVAATSSLTVAVARRGRHTLLNCSSSGWFPEPELSWLDAEGRPLPVAAAAAAVSRGPQQLFAVSSSLRVEEEEARGRTFTCRVQQSNISHSAEAHIQLHAQDGSSCGSVAAARILLNSVVAVSCVAAAVCVVWRWGPPSSSSSAPGGLDVKEPLMAGQGGQSSSAGPPPPQQQQQQQQQQGAPCGEPLDGSLGQVETILKVVNELMVQRKDLEQEKKTLQAEGSRHRSGGGGREEEKDLQTRRAKVEEQLEMAESVVALLTNYKEHLKLCHTGSDEALRMSEDH